MTTRIEIQRSNTTPAQFLCEVRYQLNKKGIRDLASDLDLDYFRRGDDLNFNINHKKANDDCFALGCEYEKSVSRPYEMQTFVRWVNGSVYNEICEFQFDADKRGTGYYYLENITLDN